MRYKKITNLGYSEAGASVSRRALKGFIPASGSPNEDIEKNNDTLRQRCRMLYMSSPIAVSAIDTNRTKIVGTGLILKPSVDRELLGIDAEKARVWQNATEKEFSLWAEKRINCDATALNTFCGMQQLALKSWLMSGDVFILIKRAKPTPNNPYSLRLQIVEADRISTPSQFFGGLLKGNPQIVVVPQGCPGAGNKVHDGVEVDPNTGKIVAYYVCNVYPTQFPREVAKWTRIEAFGRETGLPNVLHIMDSERPDQYRGVPYLAKVIEPLLQLRRYTESELMRAMVQSMFTAFIETEASPTEVPFNEVGAGEFSGTSENFANNISRSANEYELGAGTVNVMKPGEKVQFGSPNMPGNGFESFVKIICRLIGAGIEMPYDVLTKEFNSSYSASRGALLEAWEGFKMRRKWFIEDFCQPIYEIWLSEAVGIGRVQATGFWTDPAIRQAWSGSRWIAPVQGQLDPNKEANAAMTLISAGIKTHSQVALEFGGGDWAENAETLASENELLAKANEFLVTSADGTTYKEEDEGKENENG